MSDCTHDCSSCSADCASRDLMAPANAKSSIKRVIAVISGKGGVGKSTVTASLAAAMAKRGHKVAVLDADITGPSIPAAFGIHEHAMATDDGIQPAVTPGGIKIMSLNLLTNNETDPVIWRGPVIAGVVKQFWTDVEWGEVDYMFVDMPPGTGDVPLTVFQSLPVNGLLVVTSPQDLQARHLRQEPPGAGGHAAGAPPAGPAAHRPRRGRRHRRGPGGEPACELSGGRGRPAGRLIPLSPNKNSPPQRACGGEFPCYSTFRSIHRVRNLE